MKSEYPAPNREEAARFVNISDLERQAQAAMPAGAWGYLYNGAGDEWTMRQNIAAFDNKNIYPRVLADLENPELRTSILGTEISLPVIMAPAAVHGLEHVGAECATARGVAAAGTIMGISTYSNASIEDIARAGGGAPQWYQLYLSKDEGFNRFVIDKAVENGMKAVILTVDATVGGNREADARNGFEMPLPMANLVNYGAGQGQSINQIFANALQKISVGDIAKVAAYSKLPVIVKGIQAPEDALIAIGGGAAAVWVSNHGGRQLDGGPASFSVLSEIAAAVDKKVPVIFDSGIRRGQHVFKALASGADVTAIGRPALYGLAVGGSAGVKSVFDYFVRELTMVMQLAGTKNVNEVKIARLH